MSEPDPPPGCGEDAAPYVLGALTESEHKLFVAHMRECSSCREEVAALQGVADALPAAVPQLRAPAPLRDRVMATVRSEAGLRAPRARSKGSARGSARPPWRLALGGLAASAAAVLVAVLVIGGGSGSSSRVYQARVSSASGRATLRVSAGHGTLQISGIPQTAPGKVYEVWVKRGGAPQPTDALFTVSSAGDATVAVPGSIAGVRVVMVTAEPVGGSRVPTSAAVLVASLS